MQRLFLSKMNSYYFILLFVFLFAIMSTFRFPNIMETNYPFVYLPGFNPDRNAQNFEYLDPKKAQIVISSTTTNDCSKTIQLSKFTAKNSEHNQVFFIESSGKPYFDGRQSCSVESAAIKSGLVSKVLFKSANLDLSKSKTLCEIYYNYKNVEFYHVDFAELFLDTPAEGMEKRVDKVVSHGLSHYSDLARMALVYKYGGVYLDLDILVLRSLVHMKNSIVLESAKPAILMSESDQSCAIPEKTQRALKINPGQLHFEKGHPFPRAVLSYVNKHYNHKKDERDQAGPKSSSQTAKQLYGLKELLNMKVVSPEGNFTMLPDFTFMPASFSRIREELWPKKARSPAEWNDLFRCSLAVHFHSNVFAKLKVTRNPKKDFLSFLGPMLCPRSYLHVDEF